MPPFEKGVYAQVWTKAFQDANAGGYRPRRATGRTSNDPRGSWLTQSTAPSQFMLLLSADIWANERLVLVYVGYVDETVPRPARQATQHAWARARGP